MSASETQIGKDFYEFGSFRVDPAKQLVLHEGEPVPLTPKAFQLLLVLVSRCNEIVTKDELMKAVWPDTFVEETNLSRNIFALRKAPCWKRHSGVGKGIRWSRKSHCRAR